MSNLNKFIIFQCDTCKRLKELKIDGNRVDPIRCIITNKCRGKLSRVGQSSVKKFLLTPPAPGLQDYIQRGTVISAPIIAGNEPNIPLNSGDGIISLAILTRTELTGAPPTGTHVFSVLGTDSVPILVSAPMADYQTLASNVKILLNVFPISSDALQHTNYNYLKTGAVFSISGPDDSPNPSSLRFSSSNKIKIFINGIELSPTAYTISIPNQSVTFTPSIFESNNIIDVVVYNDLKANISLANIISLEFYILDPTKKIPDPAANLQIADFTLLSSSSWGNFNSVNIPNIGTRFLMHCGDLSALVNDTSYGVNDIQIVVGIEMVPAGSFVIGTYYEIISIGTTSFTDIGADENSVGILFKATDVGIGSGTAKIIPMLTVNAGSFIPGVIYTIVTVGNTDFVAFGAISNTVGMKFTATGPGVGSGTAITIAPPIQVLPSEVNVLLSSDPYAFKDKELNAYLSGNNFDSSFAFKYNPDVKTGFYELTAPQSSFNQLLSPMVPSDKISPALFAAQSTLGAALTASNINHRYIIGPT